MKIRQGLDDRPLRGAELTQRDNVVGKGSGFVARPGLERVVELRLLDQAIVQREQSEEKMAIGGVEHGLASAPRRNALSTQINLANRPDHCEHEDRAADRSNYAIFKTTRSACIGRLDRCRCPFIRRLNVKTRRRRR